MAGRSGAALLDVELERGWVVRRPDGRALNVSAPAVWRSAGGVKRARLGAGRAGRMAAMGSALVQARGGCGGSAARVGAERLTAR